MKKLLGVLLGAGGMVGLYFAADSAAEADVARAEVAGIEVGEASQDFNWDDVRLPGFEALPVTMQDGVLVEDDAAIEALAQRARDTAPLLDSALDTSARAAIRVIELSGNAVGKILLLGLKAQLYVFTIAGAAMFDAFVETDFVEDAFMGANREEWAVRRADRFARARQYREEGDEMVAVIMAAKKPNATPEEREAAKDAAWEWALNDYSHQSLWAR